MDFPTLGSDWRNSAAQSRLPVHTEVESHVSTTYIIDTNTLFAPIRFNIHPSHRIRSKHSLTFRRQSIKPVIPLRLIRLEPLQLGTSIGSTTLGCSSFRSPSSNRLTPIFRSTFHSLMPIKTHSYLHTPTMTIPTTKSTARSTTRSTAPHCSTLRRLEKT